MTSSAPALALTAAPPSTIATIANFDRISATSSSTARIAQMRRAGHTIAANASGSISTTTYTAASRTISSSHRTSAHRSRPGPTRNREERRVADATPRGGDDRRVTRGGRAPRRRPWPMSDAHLVRGAQQQHRHRPGDRDREHRQRQVAERRPEQHREVRAEQRLDRGREQERAASAWPLSRRPASTWPRTRSSRVGAVVTPSASITSCSALRLPPSTVHRAASASEAGGRGDAVEPPDAVERRHSAASCRC